MGCLASAKHVVALHLRVLLLKICCGNTLHVRTSHVRSLKNYTGLSWRTEPATFTSTKKSGSSTSALSIMYLICADNCKGDLLYYSVWLLTHQFPLLEILTGFAVRTHPYSLLCWIHPRLVLPFSLSCYFWHLYLTVLTAGEQAC